MSDAPPQSVSADYQSRIAAAMGGTVQASEKAPAPPPSIDASPELGNLPPNTNKITSLNARGRRSFTQYAAIPVIALIAAYFLLGPDLVTLLDRLKGTSKPAATRTEQPSKENTNITVTPDLLPPVQPPIVASPDILKPASPDVSTIKIVDAKSPPGTVTVTDIPPPGGDVAPGPVASLPIARDLRFAGIPYVDPGKLPGVDAAPSLLAPRVTPPAGQLGADPFQSPVTPPNSGVGDTVAPAAANNRPDTVTSRLEGVTGRFAPTNSYIVRDRATVVLPGRNIPCVSNDEIDTSLPGLVTCTVTRDVYGDDATTVVVGAGATAVGQYRGKLENGQTRIFIVWNELQDRGQVIDLDSPGVDGLGRSGVDGDNDTRFFERYKGALLVSLMQGVLSRATGNGQIVAQSTQSALGTSLSQEANIPPITRVPRGTVMNIRIARPLRFTVARK
jgi:type IV secretion system protein VirB10